jgi:hypothetical protein
MMEHKCFFVHSAIVFTASRTCRQPPKSGCVLQNQIFINKKEKSMSISRLLMVAMVLIGLSTSCADNDKSPTVSGTPVSFKLTLSSPQTRTAITDDPTAATYVGNEGTISNAVVGLFDASGTIVAKQSFTSSQITGGQVSINGSSSVTQAAVAVNVPLASFADVKTLSDFQGVQANLDNTATADASAAGTTQQYATALPMAGTNTVTINSSTNTGTAAVQLTRLVSRITLTGITTNFPGAASGESFTPTEVFMYNVAPTAYCNAASPTATTSTSSTWFHGEQVSPFLSTNQKNYLGTGALSGTAQTLPWSGFDTFYAFPNNNTTTQTRLEIKGTYKTSTSDAGTTVYYPIIINHYATGTTFTGTTGSSTPDGTDGVILNNKVYSLSATITAKGVTDPSQTFTSSTSTPVTVTMSVNTWGTTTNQNTNFGPTAAVTTDGTTYLYNDGTWGTTIPASTATRQIIGVVFSNTTTAADQAHGWSHGYALALTNAQSTGNVPWSTNTVTEFGGSFTNTMSLMMANLDGYTESKTINTKAGSNLQSQYPAFYYALNYGTAAVGGSKYAAPSSTSGWYLPSAGQGYLIAKNLGGITTTPTDGGGYGTWNNPAAYNAASTINTKLSNASSGSELINDTSGDHHDLYFWCSSEWSSSVACCTHFDGNGNLLLHDLSKASTYSGFRVRPVIAF